MVDPSRIRNGSVKPWSTLGQPWSNLVNFGQTWLTLVGFQETCPRPRFEVICRRGPSSDQAGLVRAVSFCVLTPEKITEVKMGL